MTAAAWVLVSLGTSLGSVARYVFDQWIRLLTIRRYGLGVGSRFPVGILAINLIGSFVLGLLAGAASHGLGPLVMAFFATGICAGFSTFSSWAFDTLILARDGERGLAIANVVLSVGGGMLAAAAGLGLALL